MAPPFSGLLRAIGVKGGENSAMRAAVLPFPEMTLGEFASQVKRVSGIRAIRCVGDPKAKVSKVLFGPGYATPRMTPDTDVVIGGEGDAEESHAQIAGLDLDAIVERKWRPFLRINFTLDA